MTAMLNRLRDLFQNSAIKPLFHKRIIYVRSKNHNQDHMAQATTDVLKDPVCGMTVTEESKYHEEFKGKTYFLQ